MSEVIYNVYEAKTFLSRLVDRAASGEEIILSKAGKPLAKLVPFHRPAEPRQPGGWEGQMRISEDFDAPLPPDVQAAFDGRGVTPASRRALGLGRKVWWTRCTRSLWKSNHCLRGHTLERARISLGSSCKATASKRFSDWYPTWRTT